MEKQKGEAAVIIVVVLAIIAIIGLLFFGRPMWNVWRSGLSGEAELMRAEQTKKVMVETARAERDAASLRAEAIKIMGAAAKEFPEYRQQEFIQAFGEALREGNISQIIYVPTEGNIPLTEAQRLAK